MWICAFISAKFHCVCGLPIIFIDAFCAFSDEFVWFKHLKATSILCARKQEFRLMLWDSFLADAKTFRICWKKCMWSVAVSNFEIDKLFYFKLANMPESKAEKLANCHYEFVHPTKWSDGVRQLTDATWISLEVHFNPSISISAELMCRSTKTEFNGYTLTMEERKKSIKIVIHKASENK